MQKFLAFLFFVCLSANANAQKTVPTNLEMAQMVLDFYTEPNFLDTLKAVGHSKKDSVFFLVSNNHNAFDKGTKLLFTFDKKNKKLTHTFIELDSIKKTWATRYRYDAYILEIDKDMVVAIQRFGLVGGKRLIEIAWGCCGGTQTCKVESGRAYTISGICYPRVKILYSKYLQEHILTDYKYVECDHTKEEYRTYFAKQYLK